MVGNTDAKRLCKKHNEMAFYCEIEMRWICYKCEPEKTGIFRCL